MLKTVPSHLISSSKQRTKMSYKHARIFVANGHPLCARPTYSDGRGRSSTWLGGCTQCTSTINASSDLFVANVSYSILARVAHALGALCCILHFTASSASHYQSSFAMAPRMCGNLVSPVSDQSSTTEELRRKRRRTATRGRSSSQADNAKEVGLAWISNSDNLRDHHRLHLHDV